MKIFDNNLLLAQKSLDFRSKRNELIASNIANRETPGFIAKDIVFEKELQKAYSSPKDAPLKTSDSRHFNGLERTPLNEVKGRVIHSFNPDPRKDGNTVNLDKEMAKIAENQVMFDASVKIAKYKLNLLKTAVQD